MRLHLVRPKVLDLFQALVEGHNAEPKVEEDHHHHHLKNNSFFGAKKERKSRYSIGQTLTPMTPIEMVVEISTLPGLYTAITITYIWER